MQPPAPAMDGCGDTQRFEHLVMQGGGIRCFWQAGFLSRLNEGMPLRPLSIFSVSAAAGMACAFAAGRIEFSIEWFKQAARSNRSNFYPGNLFSGKPLFPHAAIYRRLLEDVFAGPAFEALKTAPDVQVLLARPPGRCPPAAVIPLGALLYAVRSRVSRSAWERIRRWSRFSTEFVSVRHCRTPGEVADLVLASSCTPPVTPLYHFSGRPSLDGGLLESVPRSALGDLHGPALILLTKAPGTLLRGRPQDVLVHPSRPLTVAAWDYTNPAAIDALVALGKEDAERFLQSS
ncbi:patatin-like phospholipase family protein [Chitiniphilus purpureus]|uniref:Patatin-like phospholipase family protein n=1 Tax=Chitiniphilus purpureus TaxID=2981137 RepID=A0ABY6DSE7_9NEIS|nr:patatin-like phospholipase family protein [Chitiniphilus sp. CD1]UXY17310.1 patatin-like phospholipase family protein [Chitiniphilus sp. CD1]